MIYIFKNYDLFRIGVFFDVSRWGECSEWVE